MLSSWIVSIGILRMSSTTPKKPNSTIELKKLRERLEQLSVEKRDLEALLKMSNVHADAMEESLFEMASSARREGERNLKQFLEAVPVGVFVVDAEGKPYYLNQSGQTILGLDPRSKALDEIQSHRTFVAGTQQPYPTAKRPIIRALQGERARADDIEVHTATRVIPLETIASPIRDDAGKVVFVISAFQDISERRAMEAERKQFTERLEQKVFERTQALEQSNLALRRLNQEKNEFLGIAAHDLKNPLAGIMGIAEIARETPGVSMEVLEYTEMIQVSARKMLGLVTNLLDVNAIESGKLKVEIQSVDLLRILRALVGFYSNLASKKNISLILIPGNDNCVVLADETLLQQVLDNLLSNAIKYSPFGRKVSIKLERQSESLCCKVTDQGPGLSASDQANLFGKFAKLTPRPTGGEHSTGLGLFIVEKLMTAMGGRVGCQSQLGEGSTFTLTLPLPATEIEPVRRNEITFDKLRILVAEDNAVIRKLTLLTLQKLGCVPVAVENGEEAVNAIKAKVFDVVLLDVAMPEKDGLQVCREVSTVSMPYVIAMTAAMSPEDIERYREVGMRDWLGKPFTQDALRKVLIRYMEQAEIEVPIPR